MLFLGTSNTAPETEKQPKEDASSTSIVDRPLTHLWEGSRTIVGDPITSPGKKSADQVPVLSIGPLHICGRSPAQLLGIVPPARWEGGVSTMM